MTINLKGLTPWFKRSETLAILGFKRGLPLIVRATDEFYVLV